jgi:PAS domain S-box-containing protein
MNDKVNFFNFFFDSSKYIEEMTVVGRIAEFIPACMYIYDAQTGNISFANGKFRERFKHAFFETANSYGLLSDLVFADDLSALRKALAAFNKLEEQGCHSFKCRLNDPENQHRYYKTSGRVLRKAGDRVLTILFISEDITDEMCALIQSNTMNELHEQTEQIMEIGSWSLDLTDNNFTITPGLYALFGYKHAELRQPVDFYLAHILPEYVDEFQDVVNRAISERGPFHLEYAVRTTGGEIKNVLSKGRVVVEDNGRLKVIGSTSDITATKKTEQEHEKNLRELNRSNKDLEEFAYVASHDLQEPLRKIAMYSERLVAKYNGALDEDGQLHLNKIHASAQSMKVLIDNLLEFSKANGSSQGFVSLQLDRVIENVRNSLELRIEETRTIISKAPLPQVDGIPSEMEQLFTNLISNSIKFKKSSVAPYIHIDAHPASDVEKETYRLEQDRNYHVIEVKDNGIGFEQEDADRIFRIFHRLHGKAEYPGTGIGLAICKRIVDNHKGIIAAQGVPGVGSSFKVIIPEKQY